MEWIATLATVVLAVTAWLAYRSNRKLIEAGEAQLEVARATLARQSEPHLVPADPESCRIGDPIEMHVGPQVFRTRRMYVGIENAGPGLAIIQQATAVSPERGTYNVWPPPAVPAGAQRVLKLTPHGGTPLEPPPGETIEITVAYTGADALARELRFTARLFPGNDWLVQMAET